MLKVVLAYFGYDCFHLFLNIVGHDHDLLEVFLVGTAFNKSHLHIFAALLLQKTHMLSSYIVDVAHDAVIELLQLPNLYSVMRLDVHELPVVVPHTTINQS